MVWLIWIVMMLLVPALAGVKVWFDTQRDQPEKPSEKLTQRRKDAKAV